MNKAVDYCIENGILKEFPLRNKAEELEEDIPVIEEIIAGL